MQLRSLLEGISDAALARLPRSGERPLTILDLTISEYASLLADPDVWKNTGLSLDRPIFLESLERIRAVRNRVMHFRQDPISGAELHFLRSFNNALSRARGIAQGGANDRRTHSANEAS